LILAPSAGVAQEDLWFDSIKDAVGMSVGSLNPRFGDLDEPTQGEATETSGVIQGGPERAGPAPDEQMDPANLDPNDQVVAAKIREWISVAEPPENATEGAEFHYDQWGRKIGTTADGGTIRADSTPDYALGTPERTVWSMRTVLDSVNHCTLEEYVIAKLKNEPIDNCRGRYKAPEAVTVVKLTGLTLSDAKKKLEQAGLKPRLAAAKAAPTKRDEGTIVSQDPGPGAKLKPGASVKLEVYGPYNSKVTVPDTIGLSTKDAKTKLEAQGLNARLVALGPAPSNALSLMVKESEPRAGTKVKPGTEIAVKVYGKYSPPLATVPQVEGLSFTAAKDILARAGFAVSPRSAGPAPSEGKSSHVKSQEPRAGTTVDPGSEVKVYVFSKYVPPASEELTTTATGKASVGSWKLVSQIGPLTSGSHNGTAYGIGGNVSMEFGNNKIIYEAESYVRGGLYHKAAVSLTAAEPPAIIPPGVSTDFVSVQGGVEYSQAEGAAGFRMGISITNIRGDVLKCYTNGEPGRCDNFASASINSGQRNIRNGRVMISPGNDAPDEFLVSLWVTDGSSTLVLIREYTYRRVDRSSQVVVPHVEGLSFSAAKNSLTQAGFKVSPRSAGPAPSEGKSSHVKSQEPRAGTTADPGSEVKVCVFSKYVPSSNPDPGRPPGDIRNCDQVREVWFGVWQWSNGWTVHVCPGTDHVVARQGNTLKRAGFWGCRVVNGQAAVYIAWLKSNGEEIYTLSGNKLSGINERGETITGIKISGQPECSFSVW